MRPTRDDMFMEIAHVVAKRGTCLRANVGAVLVDPHNKIISIGYNGSKPGDPHCTEFGCLMVDGHCVRTTHAEINCLKHKSVIGIPGCTLYTTHAPCIKCSIYIVEHYPGVKKVIYDIPYRYLKHVNAPLQEVGIQFEQYKRSELPTL